MLIEDLLAALKVSEKELSNALVGLKGPQLVEVYNQLADDQVKKFADKPTALKRVTEALKAKAPAPAPTLPQKPRRQRQPKFNYPASAEQQPVREGTHRHTLIQLLGTKTGATFDECVAATWGKNTEMDEKAQRKTTREAIFLLHRSCGYGLTTSEDGIIKLVK